MQLILEKYHAIGNDYLVLDPNKNTIQLTAPAIQRICDRNFGIGSDGILVGPIFDGSRLCVKIFNPDGSEAEKSGSGVRIFSKYLKDFQYMRQESFVLSTLGGDVSVQYMNDPGTLLKVQMGTVTYKSSEIPVSGPVREVIDEPMNFGGTAYAVTCLSIGNPHCVIPVEAVSKELALQLGPIVETAAYFPNRINMQLLQVLDRKTIQIEIFERGAGYTLASGTSSCAAASAAHKLGFVDEDITVRMPGGTLRIQILPDESVYMTGTVSRVGTIALADSFLQELSKL